MTRRELMTAASAVAFTAASQSRVLGANDRMSIALIGCGARGSQLQPYFQASPPAAFSPCLPRI